MASSPVESVASSPDDVDLCVTKWFHKYCIKTDGSFAPSKSAWVKTYATVTNLEVLYRHFTVHSLTVGEPVPPKMSFAYALHTKCGVQFRFRKNKWVGAIKRAANVIFKPDPSDPILAYKLLQDQARAIQRVAPEAPAVINPSLLDEFRQYTV